MELCNQDSERYLEEVAAGAPVAVGHTEVSVAVAVLMSAGCIAVSSGL